MVDTLKREMDRRMEKIEDEMTAIASHIELSSSERESDGIKVNRSKEQITSNINFS